MGTKHRRIRHRRLQNPAIATNRNRINIRVITRTRVMVSIRITARALMISKNPETERTRIAYEPGSPIRH